MTATLKPLPLNHQGAETCECDNHRAYITLTRRRSTTGNAWLYAYYNDAEDLYDSMPEDEVMEYIEELLANDLPEDVPTQIEVTLPHR